MFQIHKIFVHIRNPKIQIFLIKSVFLRGLERHEDELLMTEFSFLGQLTL